MPPTQTSASDAGELGDALRAERLQLLAEALERMAAHVEAERFLLEGELLRLGPRRRVRQRDRRTGSSPSLPQPKNDTVPSVAIALVPAAVLDRLVDGGEQPRAPRAASAPSDERVERARP